MRTAFFLLAAAVLAATHAEAAGQRAAGAATTSPRPQGTSVDQYANLTGDDFHMAASTAAYTTFGNSSLACSASGGVRIASATLHVPDGASLDWLDVFGNDGAASDDLKVWLYKTCGFSPSNSALAEVVSSGATGDFFKFASIAGHRVDNEQCTYSINLMLGEGTCNTSLKLYKIRVLYTK